MSITTVQQLSIGKVFQLNNTIYQVIEKVKHSTIDIELYSWCRPIVTMWDGKIHYVHNGDAKERVNALAEVKPIEYLTL